MNHTSFCRPPSDCRGSILMITVIFSAIMAVVIGSFVRLAHHESRLADMAFYGNHSLNLAEGGLERALYALNYQDWTGWTYDEEKDFAIMQPEEKDIGRNQTGEIRVLILDYSTQPIVIAEGQTILPNRPDIIKQLRVELRPRSLFANGVTSRRGVTFSGGQADVDSYRSSDGPWDPNTNRLDNGSVASLSVEIDAVTISNARIWGRVATGGSAPDVGPNGQIRGADTPDGVQVDPNRIALDFDSDFPEVIVPSTYDVYMPKIDSSMSLGNPLATEPTTYLVDEIDLVNNVLTIVGPVILRVTGDIKVGGGAGEINVALTGSASFYVGGDMSIAGNGAVNTSNKPASLIIYGTNPIYQTFDLRGNAKLQAAIYAPEAEVSLRGGGSSGSMSGAVVAKEVKINGNYGFHYDEDLQEISGPNPSYRMELWREVHVAADHHQFGN